MFNLISGMGANDPQSKRLAELKATLKKSEENIETCKNTHEREMKSVMDDLSRSLNTDISGPDSIKFEDSALKVRRSETQRILSLFYSILRCPPHRILHTTGV